MNKLKTGLFLIVLGNILYWAHSFFDKQVASSFGDFGSGLLLGLSIGVNLIGIILAVLYIKGSKEDDR